MRIAAHVEEGISAAKAFLLWFWFCRNEEVYWYSEVISLEFYINAWLEMANADVGTTEHQVSCMPSFEVFHLVLGFSKIQCWISNGLTVRRVLNDNQG